MEGGDDVSIGENGGVSIGGVVSIGEFSGDVMHGYLFLANGLATQKGLPVIGFIGPSSWRTLDNASAGGVGGR